MIRNAAWVANVAAQAVLLWRIGRAGWPWPWMAAWLAASIASAAVLSQFAPSSLSYFAAYAMWEPILAALLVAVLVEVLAAKSGRFAAGAGRAWWWLSAVALMVAIAMGLIVSEPAWRRNVRYLWHALQVLTAGYAIAAAGSLALLDAYRVETAAAVIRHHRFLAAYAALQAVAMVAVRYRAGDANTASRALGAGLFLWWALRTGPVEKLPPPVRGPLADQLDAQQAALSGLVRRRWWR